jgi:hypothetical protein
MGTDASVELVLVEVLLDPFGAFFALE